MSFFRRIFGISGDRPQSKTRNNTIQSVVDETFRKCRFETMEVRRVLSADPVIVGAVYIEGDGGTDAEPDQFYISFEGGSAATEVTQIVIDGNQDGSPTLGDLDVYFDVTANNAAGNNLGVGDAHAFEWSNVSSGISAGEVSATVTDGGTRLVLDLVGFEAGDVLAFTIDVDQFFSSKPHDQVTSGAEFAGSSLEVSITDANYNFSPDPTVTNSTFEYNFGFGSDDIYDTDVLSGLPSETNRTAANNFTSMENRTAGAQQDFNLTPKPISISGTVFHDSDRDVSFDSGEVGIPGVTLTLQVKDASGQFVDIPHNGSSTLTTTTDQNGDYSFGTDLGLLPGTYRVIETQPTDWISSGAIAGTVSGTSTGSANGVDVLTEINIPLGDMHAIDYDFGEYKTVVISGFVGESDHDGNCVDPLSSSYQGIANVEIVAVDDAGNRFTTFTDTNGYYEFSDLLAGTYSIIETQPAAYLDGDETVGTVNGIANGLLGGNDRFVNITLAPGETGQNYNFCEDLPASIKGTVYYDQNNNGIQDIGETGISGVTVELLDSSGSVVATLQTDGNGDYCFENLAAGTYMVQETQPAVFLDGIDSVGTVAGIVTGTKQNDKFNGIELGTGDAGIEYNFGELRQAIIEGRVHTDIDEDCVYEPGSGEEAIENVLIQLLDSSGSVIEETYTDAQGKYRFDGLFPGTYSVRQIQPDTVFTVGEVVGTFNYTGSPGDGVVSENLISEITILSGAHMLDYNFCEAPAATISGFVYQDGAVISLDEGETLTNAEAVSIRDGQLTGDDVRLPGVVLELRNGITGLPITGDQALPGVYSSGAIQTTTDANGFYEFTGLKQGNYAVFQIQPDGYRDHLDTEGTNSGVPINPTDSIDPFILGTLSAGVDPANDAILRIAVTWGDNAQLNNFSEIATTISEEPPGNPPPSNPPIYPPGQTPPTYVSPSFVRGSSVSRSLTPISGLSAPTSEDGYSWHLSIIDAGSPRGDRNVDTQWQNIAYLSESGWNSVNMAVGHWRISQQNIDEIVDTPVTTESEYGMVGGVPLAGDFNGDGTDELMMFSHGFWFVDINGNMKWDSEDLWAELGSDSDIPVVGDWDGDGKDDIGVYGPQWLNDLRAIEVESGLPDLDNNLVGDAKNIPPFREDASVGGRKLKLRSNGNARTDLVDHVFRYGTKEDMPVTGDWNGDSIRNIGVFNAGQWKLDADGDGRLTSNDKIIEFGQDGDLPVVGDFNGDGVEQIGVYRGGTWIVDSNSNGELDATDKVFELGTAGDIPVVGDFDGDGIDEPSVYSIKRDIVTTPISKAG